MRTLVRWNENMISIHTMYDTCRISILYLLLIFGFLIQLKSIEAFNYLPLKQQQLHHHQHQHVTTATTICQSTQQNDNNEIDYQNSILSLPFNLLTTTSTTSSPRTWKQRKLEIDENSENTYRRRNSPQVRQDTRNKQQTTQLQPLSLPSIISSIPFPFLPNPFQNTERTQTQMQSTTTTTTTTTAKSTSIPLDRSVSSMRQQRQSQQQQQRISDNNEATTSKQRNRRREKTMPMPVRGYDATAIEEYYDYRPLEVGWRLNSLGLPLLAWYHSLLIDKLMKRDGVIEVQKQRGRELRGHLVNSKSVALIKSGQALSLRPDLIMNQYWAEELGRLVDAVGAFPDKEAMNIIRFELADLKSKIVSSRVTYEDNVDPKRKRTTMSKSGNKIDRLVDTDPVLGLFEFYNDNKVVASASIGQVYKARIRPGPQLEAAIGTTAASIWGGKIVAIKVQRPDAVGSASLDMYLIRRTATWLSILRGGSLPKIADAFGMQLFGELDYIREANNCERFRELYGNNWDDVIVPAACTPLTRRRVLVLEWIEGEKGPWTGDSALEMVSIGLRCSVDQLMNTGLFHADPHRGNLLKTPENKLGLIDFGSVVDIDEDFRYSLFGLVIGLQNKDLPLVTENLLKLGFLKDTTQLDQIIPRLTKALKNASGGTGKAKDVNFARLQAELDDISRENILQFSTPPFFTIILRSLTMLEGVAQSVDTNFRLVRGAYPYVLRQLLSSDDGERKPRALQKLLVRLLTVDGKGEEIKWETLRDFLRLAQKASKRYNPGDKDEEEGDKASISRRTIELFTTFLTSGNGIFLKKPLIHELAETIDGMASIGEGMLIDASGGFLRPLPGMKGPVNSRRMDEVTALLETIQDAMVTQSNNDSVVTTRMTAMMELLRELSQYLSDSRAREEAIPLLNEVQSVIQMVAVEVLEIRGSRAMRSVLRLQTS